MGQAGARDLLPILGWDRDWQPRPSSPKPVPHFHIILMGHFNSGQKLPGTTGDGEEQTQRPWTQQESSSLINNPSEGEISQFQTQPEPK